jgi:hypothetical protein
MQRHNVAVVPVVFTSRRIFASSLVVAGMLLVPGGVKAGIVSDPLTATQRYRDDVHTSVAVPLTAISGADGNARNQSGGFLNVGDNAFGLANPADGTGASGQGWTFHWAPAATQASVEATFNGTYFAWVVSAPTNVAAGGGNYYDPTSAAFIDRFGTGNRNEVGGALLNITANYTVPANTATDTYSLHWIQAYTATAYGAPLGPVLDNPFALGAAPFVDKGGAAGTSAGNPNAWFLDIPNAFENEYEKNPVVDFRFQVVLALDDQTTDAHGVKQNSVTLLGGFRWGYTYTAMETPEPASITLAGVGAVIGAFIYARRRRQKARSESGQRR